MGLDNASDRTRSDSKMSSFENTLKGVKDQLEGLSHNIKQMDGKITKQGNTLTKLEEALIKITEMEKEILAIKAENTYFKKKMQDIETGIENQLIHERRNQIEITGIPKAANERLVEIITTLTKDTEAKVSGEDIESCIRARSRDGRDGRIIVNFKEAQKRDKTLRAIKQNKPELSKLKMEPKNRKIFANEVLTPNRKYLLYRTKIIAREKGWHRVWTYSGTIYIKMEKEGQQIKLERIEDLEILLK